MLVGGGFLLVRGGLLLVGRAVVVVIVGKMKDITIAIATAIMNILKKKFGFYILMSNINDPVREAVE